jgi:alpha-L-arabinofuranosidase
LTARLLLTRINSVRLKEGLIIQKAFVSLDPNFHCALINPRLFVSFIEHISCAVYIGMNGERQPHADAERFRMDVVSFVEAQAVQETESNQIVILTVNRLLQ